MDKQDSRKKRILRLILFLIAAVALGLFLVDDWRQDGDPPAARLLPDLPQYRQVEGQTITTYIGALSQGAALLAGQPQLALTIGALDQVIDCYQEVGGVRARVYSHADEPLRAGLVAVVDEARMNDPALLFRCVAPATLELEGTDEPFFEPCTAAFSLVREDGTFHVVYAASSPAACVDFCTAIDGCEIHTADELEFSSIAQPHATAIINRFAPG